MTAMMSNKRRPTKSIEINVDIQWRMNGMWHDECAVETTLDCRHSIESESRLVGVFVLYMVIIHVAFSIYVFMRLNVMHYYAQTHTHTHKYIQQTSIGNEYRLTTHDRRDAFFVVNLRLSFAHFRKAFQILHACHMNGIQLIDVPMLFRYLWRAQ